MPKYWNRRFGPVPIIIGIQIKTCLASLILFTLGISVWGLTYKYSNISVRLTEQNCPALDGKNTHTTNQIINDIKMHFIFRKNLRLACKFGQYSYIFGNIRICSKWNFAKNISWMPIQNGGCVLW